MAAAAAERGVRLALKVLAAVVVVVLTPKKLSLGFLMTIISRM